MCLFVKVVTWIQLYTPYITKIFIILCLTHWVKVSGKHILFHIFSSLCTFSYFLNTFWSLHYWAMLKNQSPETGLTPILFIYAVVSVFPEIRIVFPPSHYAVKLDFFAMFCLLFVTCMSTAWIFLFTTKKVVLYALATQFIFFYLSYILHYYGNYCWLWNGHRRLGNVSLERV